MASKGSKLWMQHLLITAIINLAAGSPCFMGWELVYEHNKLGEPILGRKSDLMDAVFKGAEIKISVPNWGPAGYLTSVQNTQSVDNNLCAQSLFHVSKTDYNTFQNVPYFWFVNVCTTGYVTMARYYIGNHVSAGMNNDTIGVQWFIRRLGDPIFSHTQDGSVITGSVDRVVWATEAGSDLRIVDRCLGYSVRMDNVEIAPNRSQVAGQSLWHVSEKKVDNNLAFQGDDYWWFSMWSTDGDVHVSRWSIGEHVHRGNSSLHQSMDWYSDSCWKMAYSHDENGTRHDGSLEMLTLAVEMGNRVKVLVGGILYEANQINIRGGHINAQIISSVSKQDIENFSSDIFWNWMVVTTTGTVSVLNINVGEYVKRGEYVYKLPMTWFVDTRYWKRVLVNDKQGNVVSGSKAALIESVKRGADIRYLLAFTNNSLIQQADNVEISTDGNIGAMHIRSVSLKFTHGSQSEVSFQSNPYWWFTIVSSSGKVDISRWTVGEHVNRRHTDLSVTVEWFVGE